MKMSLRALNPRSVRLSPAGVPPSPAVIVRPGTLRSTSRSVVAPCSSITVLGDCVDCGVSRSGSVFRRRRRDASQYFDRRGHAFQFQRHDLGPLNR